jgi:hypothetical protein
VDNIPGSLYLFRFFRGFPCQTRERPVRCFFRVVGMSLRLSRNTRRRRPDDLVGILDSQPREGTKKPLVVTSRSVMDPYGHEVFVGVRTGIYGCEADRACERYKEGCRGLQRDGMVS